MSLENMGWNDLLAESFVPHAAAGTIPARVTRDDASRYLVWTETEECYAETAGRLKHRAQSWAELPAVGDWVVLRRQDGGISTITDILPRSSVFSRKVAGETTEEQIVAANVDTVFLVSGLDHDFNPRRIERYLTATWESGASPVVVLNKADVAVDLAAAVAEVESVAIGVPVVSISALESRGLEVLSPWLVPGSTVALLGSSGVGKSTLVNALCGESRQRTHAVREGDSRGRHTTTHRELVRLPGGALLVDTPGMRELQLWGGEESADTAFPEVVALADACRFHDCRHRTEPDCAIRSAIERGDLDPARFAAWQKLQRELAHFARRHDARAQSEIRARWKQVAKAHRKHPKSERWQ
ncbi:MAG: ribosome small subunit-dependent GTPase A [Candidatus Eisenbacteria bacterium]